MRDNSLIDKSLKEDLIQDMEKRTKLEEKISKDIDVFMSKVSCATIYSIMGLVLKQGHPQQRKHMKEVQERYENDGLILDDTLFLLDMFEKNYDQLLEDDEC